MAARHWVPTVAFVALAQIVVGGEISGQTQQRTFDYQSYHVKGAGTVDCGKMTSELRANRKEWEGYYENYALGFLTGTNFHAADVKMGNPQIGNRKSPEALLAAMEQFCGQYPLKDVADALVDLYSQLEQP